MRDQNPVDQHTPLSPARPAGELFTAYRALVYRWACAHGLRHDAALDVTQETFARFLASSPRCPTEASQVAWLRRTASNLSIDTRRLSRPRPVAAEPLHQETPHEEPVRLAPAMRTLTEPQRLVLLAKAVEGLSFAQAAAALAISIPTAKTHYARALRTLRECLIQQGVPHE